MRLSKIRLAGFKSFVDPTTVPLPSNLMGVVGPNGCGKSNIIDAIRWVMGESSAKTLRGESMADVIFNGSAARKPVAQASIELVFDNADGAIGGAYAKYAEVSIRRVLSRDGTSSYFLNNTRCRRKDITHIFLGTGLGPRSYSIIEQGMISRLVEARPEELRAFLEEAAGISKYKDRRRETENRMRHTRENLERLADLREEVDKQLAHLKRQARAAERFKELKANERELQAQVLALKLRDLRAAVEAEEHAMRSSQTALDAALAEQRSVEASIERVRVDLTERNDGFNKVQGEYYRVGADIARLEQSIQHRKELRGRQEQDLEATRSSLAEIIEHMERDRGELTELEQLLDELGPGLEQAQLDERASAEALAAAEAAIEAWRERRDQLNQRLAEAEQTIGVERARQEHGRHQAARFAQERQRLTDERATLTAAELEEQLGGLVGSEQRLRAERDEAAKGLDALWGRIQSLRKQESEVAGALDSARSQLQDDRGRLASMEALQQAALGEVSGDVTAWLADHDLAARPRLAQALAVRDGWDRAVETVLGSYLEAVCVDGIDQVAGALGSLGDAGIMLLQVDSARSPAVGRGLAGMVDGPQAAKELLANVRTAESLQQALSMRRQLDSHESVITREGIWMGARWLRVNRSDDPRSGVLARGEEITRLRVGIDTGSREVSAAEQRLTALRGKLDELEDQRSQAQVQAGERQEAYAEAKAELDRCRSRLEQTRERAAELDRAITAVAGELRASQTQVEQTQQRLSGAEAHVAQLEEERQQLEVSGTHYRHQLEGARERASADRELAQEMAIKVESRRTSRQSATVSLSRLASQRSQLEQRERGLLTQIEGAGEPLSSENMELERLLERRLLVEQALNEARRAVENCDELLRELETERTAKEQAVNTAREQLDGLRLNVREVQVRTETVAEQFARTGFVLEEVVQALPEDATVASGEESLEKLERRIQRLGPINLAAIDEFQEQSERKEYLDTQFADLTDALETLESAIRKIDRETRTRFKETFDNVNAGLGRLFPRLFGGGHAYLELDGDDLLNSGVTVMARPPGKRISTIHLLSGGEKALTAVAMVFAIFHLNPAPFCLLDEVDAPLDDANVGRFCDIVREMADQVQFVIITHNKTTMEMVNQLSGVTMHEPGVSRLVVVDIDEAVQLAAM
jgi:chromosome segregation protein